MRQGFVTGQARLGGELIIDFIEGVFTVLGATPDVPDTLVDDLVSFPDGSGELDEAVASNASAADGVVDDPSKEESKPGNPICNKRFEFPGSRSILDAVQSPGGVIFCERMIHGQ